MMVKTLASLTSMQPAAAVVARTAVAGAGDGARGVAHKEVIEQFDHVLCVHQGRLVEHGPREELPARATSSA